MPFFFGRRPVLELLRGNRQVYRVLLARDTTGPIIDRILSLAKDRGVSVLRVPKKQIESMFPMLVHQGVVAETEGEHIPSYSIDELFMEIDKNKSPLLLMLDSIEDPRNLGALIRTANAVGVQGVIIPKHRSAAITPVVIKASAGAAEFTPIVQVANLIQVCNILKKKGLWVIGADPSSVTQWYEVDMTCPIAIVLGGEKKGIRRLLREECDFIVGIPMLGKIGSLNVSVAGGILMYEALRQRISPGMKRPAHPNDKRADKYR